MDGPTSWIIYWGDCQNKSTKLKTAWTGENIIHIGSTEIGCSDSAFQKSQLGTSFSSVSIETTLECFQKVLFFQIIWFLEFQV